LGIDNKNRKDEECEEDMNIPKMPAEAAIMAKNSM
jgi:hypothetical protein